MNDFIYLQFRNHDGKIYMELMFLSDSKFSLLFNLNSSLSQIKWLERRLMKDSELRERYADLLI